MYFWGIVYLITTTLVWILKSEKASEELTDNTGSNCGIKDTFRVLMNIIKLPAMRLLIVVLLTIKVGLFLF